MRFQVPGTGKIVYLKLKFNVFDEHDWNIGLDSGRAFAGSHYLLLDYDEVYPTDFFDILVKHKIKRGLIVESSPGRYHAIAFSPMPYDRLIQIMVESKCDRKQLEVARKNGFVTVRVTPKQSFKIKVEKELNNGNGGTNFYNYYAENCYLKEIQRDKDGN